MRKVFYGLLAGFTATVVLSALLWLKSAAGLLPGLDTIELLADLAYRYAGLPASANVGWLMHFAIGLVWGGLFGAIAERMPSEGYPVKGMVFGVLAWLLMMLVLMPVAGAGLFAMTIGLMAPLATLVLHLVFGAVMGFVQGAFMGHGATTGVIDAHSTS
jgi:uncharacterized membrane protein YagU involved in acid resistance